MKEGRRQQEEQALVMKEHDFGRQNGLVKVTCMLIDHNANVNQGTNYNITPLHWACMNGHVEVACMLIDHGADFNIINVCCLDSVTD